MLTAITVIGVGMFGLVMMARRIARQIAPLMMMGGGMGGQGGAAGGMNPMMMMLLMDDECKIPDTFTKLYNTYKHYINKST